MPNFEFALSVLGSALDEYLRPKPCHLHPGTPSRWSVDFGAFGELDNGHALTIDGAVFRFVAPGIVAGPGETPIDAWSAARDAAAAIVINQALEGVKALAGDPILTLIGPPGMQVTSDAPSLVVTLLDPGALPVCL